MQWTNYTVDEVQRATKLHDMTLLYSQNYQTVHLHSSYSAYVMTLAEDVKPEEAKAVMQLARIRYGLE